MAYKNFTGEDVSEDIGLVTSGIWQDGASNIQTFFSSSTQYTNTGDYNIDVYRYDPSSNASASVQFGIVYGHKEGSGSLGTKGATGDRTTAAIFGQFNNVDKNESLQLKRQRRQNTFATQVPLSYIRGPHQHYGTGKTGLKLKLRDQ